MSEIFPRLVWGSVYLVAKTASTTGVWRFYVQVAWYFYIHILRITSMYTSTCTLTTNLASTAMMINFVVYVIHIRAPFFVRNIFYSRGILKRSRSLFARLVLCAAFYIREAFWKDRDLYTHTFLWAQRFLFVRQSEKVEISIHASSFVRCVFYSRVILKNSRSRLTRLALSAAFSIHETIWKLAISIRASSFVRSVFYSRVMLKSSQSLCARLSLSAVFSIRETIGTLAISIRASSFVRSVFYSRAILKTRDLYSCAFVWALCLVFLVCVQWNISIVVLYISLSLCMGENNGSFQEDLLSYEHLTPRPSVSRTNSLVWEPPTLWFRGTILLTHKVPHKIPQTLLNKESQTLLKVCFFVVT